MAPKSHCTAHLTLDALAAWGWQAKSHCTAYLTLDAHFLPMDETIVLLASSCAALAVLVYLMYKSATGKRWKSLSRGEKERWKHEEKGRKAA